MPDWSRRRALRTVAGAVAVSLAGCRGTTTGSNDDPPVFRERVYDVEVTTARNTDADPLFVADEGSDTDDGDGAARAREFHHLTTDADVEDLRFRDGAADLEAFVTETDLETESVYLAQGPIGACYAPRLVAVYREGQGVDAEFTRDLRPADFECDADDCDVVAVAVRLPFAGDGFTGVGFSTWGSECRDQRAVARTDGGDGP